MRGKSQFILKIQNNIELLSAYILALYSFTCVILKTGEDDDD